MSKCKHTTVEMELALALEDGRCVARLTRSFGACARRIAMRPKGDGCWSVTKAELLAHLCDGGVLWYGKLGPLYYMPIGTPDNAAIWTDLNGSSSWVNGRWVASRECHPRRDTVKRLIAAGVLVRSGDANKVQQSTGMDTYRLAASNEARPTEENSDATG